MVWHLEAYLVRWAATAVWVGSEDASATASVAGAVVAMVAVTIATEVGTEIPAATLVTEGPEEDTAITEDAERATDVVLVVDTGAVDTNDTSLEKWTEACVRNKTF